MGEGKAGAVVPAAEEKKAGAGVIELDGLPAPLRSSLARLDRNKDGTIDPSEILRGSGDERIALHHFSEKHKKLLAAFDTSGDGAVDEAELALAGEALAASRVRARNLKRTATVLAGVIIAGLLAIFGLVFAVVDLTKETTTDGHTLTVARGSAAGETVATAQASFEIDLLGAGGGEVDTGRLLSAETVRVTTAGGSSASFKVESTRAIAGGVGRDGNATTATSHVVTLQPAGTLIVTADGLMQLDNDAMGALGGGAAATSGGASRRRRLLAAYSTTTSGPGFCELQGGHSGDKAEGFHLRKSNAVYPRNKWGEIDHDHWLMSWSAREHEWETFCREECDKSGAVNEPCVAFSLAAVKDEYIHEDWGSWDCHLHSLYSPSLYVDTGAWPDSSVTAFGSIDDLIDGIGGASSLVDAAAWIESSECHVIGAEHVDARVLPSVRIGGLENALQAKGVQLKGLEKQGQDKDKRIAALEEQVKAVTAQLQSAQGQAKTSAADVTRLTGELARAADDYSDLQGTLSTTKGTLATCQTSLAASEVEVKGLEADVVECEDNNSKLTTSSSATATTQLKTINQQAGKIKALNETVKAHVATIDKVCPPYTPPPRARHVSLARACRIASLFALTRSRPGSQFFLRPSCLAAG